MKLLKQQQTIECLASGYYQIVNGQVYCKIKGSFKIMKPNILPSGYYQLVISNHRRGDKNISVRVYTHVLIYIATNGLYPVGWEIDHIDRDKNNTMPENLRAVPTMINAINKDSMDNGGCLRPIRGFEIDNIRTLLKAGRNQSEIARELNLNRLSVRYTIKNIEAGKKLKYDGVYEKKYG